MLRRSPLALKQPPLGKKGRQRCRDKAAIGEGLALNQFSFCVTYLGGFGVVFVEVPGLHGGR